MKKLIVLLLAFVLGLGITFLGCDDDDDNNNDDNDDNDTATDTDTDTDTDSDSDTDTDSDSDTEPAGDCGDADSNYPAEYHCTYDTTFVNNCCFDYALGISKADAEADCKHHRQGGHPPSQDLILGEKNWKFGEGPCDSESSGYCFSKNQTPSGREYTPISTPKKPENDCKPAVLQSSAWGCETMGGGKYCCTI